MNGRVFTDREEELLREIGTVTTVQPGHPIYLKGDPADKIYYILKGRVRVFENIYSGREMNLDVVEAGRIFGESAFEEKNVRPTCVQAVNTVTMISFSASDLLLSFRKKPDLALRFLQLCSRTMDHLAARMHDQCLLDRYGKVANYILDEIRLDSADKGTAGGMLPYTHEQLAISLGLNRSTVSTVLKKFERNGWLESGYQYVRILDPEALSELVEQQKKR